MLQSKSAHTLALLIFTASCLQGCGSATHMLVKPSAPASKDVIAEPAADEVVIVINNNSAGGTHAGIFAGMRLNDPSGSYVGTRTGDKSWPGPTLADYVAFQKEDGANIQLYRFRLALDSFSALDARMAAAGPTPPLFCAMEVNSLISGISPFENIPQSGWVSPAELGRQLDKLTREKTGKCEMPDQSSC